MYFDTIEALVKARPDLAGGVVAVLLCETPAQTNCSMRRLAAQGAGSLIVIGDAPEPSDLDVQVVRVKQLPSQRSAWSMLNQLIDLLAGRWLLWLWNGEYFVFPFGETRTLSDLAAFLGDERRKMIFTYAFDLYANDLPNGGDNLEEADLHFDRIGYHAFPRDEKVLRLFGGLGWRFAEFAPRETQQIGRTSLFKAEKGVWMDRKYLFEDAEYASVQCKWHHNPTAAVMSLRRTRRILAHPEFHRVRGNLLWEGSEKFDWTSRQLLELGMIEPGQWF
ncbi:MAG: hypothetical protein AAGD13_03950 [Pseudomonadota bacterium]